MAETDGNEGRKRTPGRPRRCPRCGGNPLAVDDFRNRLLCTHCGYIVKDLLPDLRLTNLARDERKRAGAPSSRRGGPSTVENSENGGNQLGHTLPPKDLPYLIQSECLARLYRIASGLDLPDGARRKAIELVGLAGKKGMNIERRPVLTASAAVYLAEETPDARTARLGQLARATGRSKKKIRKAGGEMSELLGARPFKAPHE